MWIPLSLEIVNLTSHKHTYYEFNERKAVMIFGINKDDEGQESNGAGKSGFIEAIALALTGDHFRDVRSIELVRNGEKTAEIIFKLMNPVLKRTMSIHRKIHSGAKSSEVTVTIGGSEQRQMTSVNEANKLILEQIDISKEDLVNYFIISKETYISFLKASDGNKKKIINRFCKGDQIDKIVPFVEKDVEEKNVEVIKIEREIASLNGKIQAYQDQIEELKEEDPSEEQRVAIEKLDQKVNSLTQDICRYHRDITHAELEQSSTKNKLQLLEESLSPYNGVDFNKKLLNTNEEKRDLITKKGLAVKEEIEELEDFIAEIERNIKGSIDCPECGHNFCIADKEYDLKQAKEILPGLKEDLETKKQERLKIGVEYKELETKKAELNKAIDERRKKKAEIEDAIAKVGREIKSKSQDIEGLHKKIDLINQERLRIEEQIEELRFKKLEDKSIPLKNKINELEVVLESALQKKDDTVQEKAEIEEWIYNFNRFKSHLANQSINSIAGYANFYLQKMKSNLQIQVEGYKVLASKKIKEEITTKVLRNGLPEGSYGKFSGGEKARIDIAAIIAVQKLINLNSSSGGLDLIILDEVIESVDSKGVYSIVHSLNSLNQNIMLVTFANMDSDYEHKLIFKKENGETKIVDQNVVEAI